MKGEEQESFGLCSKEGEGQNKKARGESVPRPAPSRG